MEVVKSSGARAPFDEDKVFKSLIRAGATGDVAFEVVKQVKSQLRDGMSTKDIYAIAYEALGKKNVCLACRYDVRQGLVKLGPSGFAFERYVAALFRAQGYRAVHPDDLQGACVAHEVDVLLEREGRRIAVEVKFRNSYGDIVQLKDTLAAFARYCDLVDGSVAGLCEPIDEMWVVTNGRMTSTAFTYATCKKMRVISWDQPRDGSLPTLISHSGLYPITVIPGLIDAELQALVKLDIVTCRQLGDFEAEDLAQRIDVLPNRAATLIQLAEEIAK